MNFLDIIIIVPVLYGAWIGFKKGLIIEVCTLLALVLGVWGGVNFSDYVSDWMKNDLNVTSKYLPVIAFTVTFLVVGAIVYFAGKAIEKMVNIAQLKPLNKIGGLGFGVAKFIFIVSVGLVILDAYDQQGGMLPDEMKQGSLLYEPIKDFSMKTLPALKNSAMQTDGLSTSSLLSQD